MNSPRQCKHFLTFSWACGAGGSWSTSTVLILPSAPVRFFGSGLGLYILVSWTKRVGGGSETHFKLVLGQAALSVGRASGKLSYPWGTLGQVALALGELV